MDAVLEATLQVLKRDGYGALTTTAVARRAGVSVGTLYQYFPDRDSLVTALKVRYFERIVATVQRRAAEVTGQPLEMAIPAVVHELLRFKKDNLDLSVALREPMAALGGEAIVREATGRLVASVRDILEADRPGLPRAGLMAQVLASAIEGVLSSVVDRSPQQLADPRLAEELTCLALAYARGGPPRGA